MCSNPVARLGYTKCYFHPASSVVDHVGRGVGVGVCLLRVGYSGPEALSFGDVPVRHTLSARADEVPEPLCHEYPLHRAALTFPEGVCSADALPCHEPSPVLRDLWSLSRWDAELCAS